jgi:hypothetical protein
VAKKKIMLSFDEDLLIEMRVRAIREKTNLSALTEKLYQEYLKKAKKAKTKR